MFKDYYAILEINTNATNEEIKMAFKKQAIRWHPDHNPGIDTTEKMQDINEAKLILLDIEARAKYDIEYANFKDYQKQTNKNNSKEEFDANTKYKIKDDVLYKWIKNAQRQAVDLAKQTIKDFKGMAAVGLKEGLKASGNAVIGQLIIGVIFLLIFGLAKSCK